MVLMDGEHWCNPKCDFCKANDASEAKACLFWSIVVLVIGLLFVVFA